MANIATNNSRRRREICVIGVHYEEENLVADFDPQDQRAFQLGAQMPLNVDLTHYQRGIDWNFVEKLRGDWDPDAYDAATLSVRSDGSLWIVNGQHVITAAILQGEKELLVEINWGLTVPGEADLRLKKNNSRSDTALEKFHARLTKELEGPGIATAIVALLEQFDAKINKSPNKYVGINCVAAVERVYKWDNGVILRRTCRAIIDAFGSVDGEAARADVIQGVAWFMTVHYGDYRYKRFIERIQREGPEGLGNEARGFRRLMGGSTWLNTYRAIVKAYNDGFRREDLKLEPKTSRYTKEVPARAARLERVA